MTYISLFSSAGIGCYGFKQESFECVATNELIERRLEIQKFNHKCKYESGYICGDITQEATKALLSQEIEKWKKAHGVKRIDVVIATPPCQGMSVANHKKKDTEIVRNSLVIESIKIIKEIKPRFFIFENVPAFMKTICTDTDGVDKPIAEAIERNLGSDYSYAFRIINFKNYGACSSRQRTIVIGVSNDYADVVSPFELFPEWKNETTLFEAIGHLPSLKTMGEISPADIYHSFRPYPAHMRSWISDLKEGESAFDNEDDSRKPHQIIDGQIVVNQNKNGDKYKRQLWDKVGPCVHTRNDQLASQNTIHPSDDRVFSIRELMLMMTVPYDFRWTDISVEELNALSQEEKTAFLKANEIKIRQSLGEAVPTAIFRSIASKIVSILSCPPMKSNTIKKALQTFDFSEPGQIVDFVELNPLGLALSDLSRIAELANTNRTDDAAFYTNKALITEMVKLLPDVEKDTIYILEPSVGVGNFIPMIAKRYAGKKIVFDLVDIDPSSLEIAKRLLQKYRLLNCEFNYICDDFLTHQFTQKYDFVIGNPPFYKMSGNDPKKKEYLKDAINKDTSNICSYFLDKIQALGNHIAIVFPKFLLNTPEFATSREYLKQKCIEAIIDFGEKGFPGVTIETIALFINNTKKPKNTLVRSVTDRIELRQLQSYICDDSFPYWLIYRDSEFDRVVSKMTLGLFDVFRDRQITNHMLHDEVRGMRVLKARNISDSGADIVDIPGYDSYIDEDKLSTLSVSQFINSNTVYLSPNMTYYPRVMPMPPNVIVNGSVAILLPKCELVLSERQRAYFASSEFRRYYRIARNYQTRSLNIDSCSVFFFGVLKEQERTD
ncbi:MAG: DNA (cytosine-5-)-methyltransferase [Ruminococcaceae bacterium]|nr:DNA (cytosine-5-)-methyltransferase [Oscillospiraceae bacterium]